MDKTALFQYQCELEALKTEVLGMVAWNERCKALNRPNDMCYGEKKFYDYAMKMRGLEKEINIVMRDLAKKTRADYAKKTN